MNNATSSTKQQLIEDNIRLRNTLESLKRAIAVSVALNDKMLADIDAALATTDADNGRLTDDEHPYRLPKHAHPAKV